MNILKKYLLIIFLLNTYIFASTNNTHIHFTSEEKDFIKNNSTINVGVETDWPPFDFFENGKYAGFAKEYLEIIEKKTGLKFNLIPDTWKNLISKVKNKEIDLLPCLAKTAKREKFLLFTESYVTTRDYLFASENNDSIENIEDIKGKTVAVVKGYVQEETFKKEHPEVNIFYAKNLLDSMDAVITKKADFIIANIALMNYHTQKNSISNLEAKFHFGYNWNRLHMAVRDDYEILRAIIQKALDSITEEEKRPIIKKWIKGDFLEKEENDELKLTLEEKEFLKNKKTLTIANSLGWLPYDYYENSEAKGYVVDYIKLISNKLGVKPIFISDKWSILLKEFKKNKIDVLPAISYRKSREEFINYADSYMNQTLSIVTKSSRTDIITSDDLKDKKIGMMKSWGNTKAFKNSYPNANVIEFESLNDIFNSIRDNFIDATIQNKILSSFYINKDYYKELKIVSETSLDGFNGKLHMGVGKEAHTLKGVLNKAINSITKEELKLLDDKWVNTSDDIDLTNEEKDFIKNHIVKVSTIGIWSPFIFKDENDKIKGISYDFWKKIVDKVHLKSDINIEEKFTTAVNQLKNKEVDINIATSITKDRKEFAIFSNSYLKSIIGVATLQDKNYISDAKKLIGKKIAVGKNFTAHKLLEERFPDSMDFIFVESVKEGLELVSKNKAFAYVDVMHVLSYNIKTHGFTNIKISGQTGIDFNLHMMIRDDLPILQSIVNKVLNRISIEEKEEIYNKWLSVEYYEKFNYKLFWQVIIVFLFILILVLYKNRQLLQYQKSLKLANKKTEESLKNFRKLIDLNIAGVLIIRDKKIKDVNSEVLKILKYDSKDELINQDVSKIFDTKDIESLCSILTDVQSYETDAISKSKNSVPVLLKGQIIDFDNLPSHIISLVDLTDIKNKEKLMLHQSKMASLGEMIGNIAHQWRQPLSSISTAASGMRLQKEFNQLSDETLYESLDKITETTQFLSQTIDDFKNYIKENKAKKEFSISDSIERVLSIMKASFVNNFIVVEKDLENVIIENYENELNQVLLNILSNSKDAIKNLDKDEKYIFIKAYKKENSVIIEITDNGGGIDEYVIKRVFEPYFTTKHKSQGTGLGLYMTHQIITESMDGEIFIENCTYKEYKNCTKVTLHIPF